MAGVLYRAHRAILFLRGMELLQTQMATGLDDQGQEEEAVSAQGWTKKELLYHGGPE